MTRQPVPATLHPTLTRRAVFLLDTLVAEQTWAQQMVERRRAVAVSCIDEITNRIVSPDRVRDVSDLLHVEPALL